MQVHDFNPDVAMSPMVGILHATVKYNYDRFVGIVNGLSQYEIDYRGSSGKANSIAQLIRHLAVVDLHWVFRLHSKEIPLNLIETFGPMHDQDGKLSVLKNIPIQVLLDEYEGVQNMFRDVCLKLSDEDLPRTVPYENNNSATIRWGIWHIADHSRYHQAHINKLLNELKG
jgi:uncharacterized damage-inducible protein DinB